MSHLIYLGIDPGTNKSGWVLFDRQVLACGIESNERVLRLVESYNVLCGADRLAIEMISSQGQTVGREVFETARWVGRFQQAWRNPDEVSLIYRPEMKKYLCGTTKANDSMIRAALIERLGPPGSSKAPGPTYGVTSHAWQALAVAVTAQSKGE